MDNSESFVGRGDMIVMIGRVSFVYIKFLGDLFYLSCYGFVMTRLEHLLETGGSSYLWVAGCGSRVEPGCQDILCMYIVSCRGLPGATSGGFR